VAVILVLMMGFMNCAIEMASVILIYIPSFVKFSHSEVREGDTHTQTAR
jgi:hypothetical protein